MENRNSTDCPSNKFILSFFDDYSLEECQTLLWQLFKLSITANQKTIPKAREWLNLISFYENLNELLKAIYKTKHP